MEALLIDSILLQFHYIICRLSVVTGNLSSEG